MINEHGSYDKTIGSYTFTSKKVDEIPENLVSFQDFIQLEERVKILEEISKAKLKSFENKSEFSSVTNFINVLIEEDIDLNIQKDEKSRGGMLSARVRQSTKESTELLAKELGITTTKLLEFCIVLGIKQLKDIKNSK